MDTGAPTDGSRLKWPEEGVTRVPYGVFADPEIHALEQERIFRGPTWNFLGLEAELPNIGDYRVTHVGDTPVIVTRGPDGEIHAMVNRCAHRGAMVALREHGNCDSFTCVYHNWTYDLCGRLTGVAFEKGIKGKGGMDRAFDHGAHGLERLRVDRYRGLIFGTFDRTLPPLYDHIGPDFRDKLDRVFTRPVKILGYHSQMLPNNWKLYMENVRDSYHASLLHTFFVTFKLHRLTMDGGIMVDDTGWNHVSYSMMMQESAGESGVKLHADKGELGLNDPALVDVWPEYDDGITIMIQTVFPTFTVQQIHNVLGVRLMVPHGPNQSELRSWMLGYEDDTPAQIEARLAQNNLIGPAGLVSMEDGCIGGFVQRGTRGDPKATSFVEMGGRGTGSSQDSRATETSIRAYWKAYKDMMGL